MGLAIPKFIPIDWHKIFYGKFYAKNLEMEPSSLLNLRLSADLKRGSPRDLTIGLVSNLKGMFAGFLTTQLSNLLTSWILGDLTS